jgi:hypothetical protein
VAADGSLTYDSLVRPEGCIIDCNTRFSGIAACDLRERPTKTVQELQNDLLGFIGPQKILVIPGFRSETRNLLIICGTVIDTSVVFPPYYGHPHRCSLKSLAELFSRQKSNAVDLAMTASSLRTRV